MASIFISYRREDAAGHAGRLCDRLSSRFGDDRVFMDVQDIQPGQNFPQSIDTTIARCDCVIAVIGPRWLELLQARGAGEDYVRREIGSALKRGITVVPVLTGNARMPPPHDLPQDLSRLSHINALEVRDERFKDDVARLESLLHQLIAGRGLNPSPPWFRSRMVRLGLPVLIVAAIAAAFLSTREGEPAIDGAWLAEMQKPGQTPYRVRLQFVETGSGITGVVQYPTGDGPMLDVERDGSMVRFHTAHVPQFEDGPVTIRFQAEVTGEEMRLTTTDPAGVATGVARRAQSP
jgi:hypothetical protein